MQNKLVDLNNHLFAQLERLGDEDLKGEELAEERERAKAIAGVAAQIIGNGNLMYKAMVFKAEHMNEPPKRLPPMWDD